MRRSRNRQPYRTNAKTYPEVDRRKVCEGMIVKSLDVTQHILCTRAFTPTVSLLGSTERT